MEIGFAISNKKLFSQAFYRASKAYYHQLFNIRAPQTYFFDALYHYYHHGTEGRNFTEFEDDIRYFFTTSENIYTEIYHDGTLLKICVGFGYGRLVSLHEFVVRLARKFKPVKIERFPPVKKFIAFPVRNIAFNEKLLKCRYPEDLSIFVELSYKFDSLIQWLNDRNVFNDYKIVFTLGYETGISDTLIEYLVPSIPYIEPYRGIFDPILLQYMRDRIVTPELKAQYGNYTLYPIDFSRQLNVTSSLKFINSEPAIPLRKPILCQPTDLVLTEEIGRGSFGIVRQTNNPELVVKEVDFAAFEDELKGLSLVHRHLVSYENVAEVLQYDIKKRLFVMNKLNELTMGINPFEPQNGNIPIFLQMIRGLYSFHATGLAHNDIKPKNIMKTNDGIIKLIDFGLVESFCEKRYYQIYGTPMYNPPETISQSFDPDDQRLMPARDIWAVTLTAYEMLLGRSIYSYVKQLTNDESMLLSIVLECLGNSPIVASSHIAAAVPRKLFDIVVDPDLVAILRRCVSIDPFRRATSLEILQSPYAQRYLSIVPLTISPCRRQKIINGNPFAGYRTRKQRENWIVLCDHFKISGIAYAPYFESRHLPQELTYFDYVAIINIFKRTKMKYFALPHPVPLTNGSTYDLNDRSRKYRSLVIEPFNLELYLHHRRHEDIRRIVTRGYLDGKCEYMSVLELLAE